MAQVETWTTDLTRLDLIQVTQTAGKIVFHLIQVKLGRLAVT